MSVHPPGPPFWQLPGLLRKLAVDRLAMMRDAADLSDAVRVSMGPKKMYIFNRPDYAKHVLADNAANYHKGIGLVESRKVLGDGLLTSEGDLWKAQRRNVQPAFKPGRIAAQAGVVAEESGRLLDLLRLRAGGGAVDVLHEVTGLTLGVLGRTLMDTSMDGHDGIAHAFEAVQDQAMFDMVTQGLMPTWLPFATQRNFRRARTELTATVDVLVADRSARMSDGDGADDAFSRMILAARKESDPALGRKRLQDELVTLLLAGHETTASTLGWTLLLLARHPHVRDLVREEARAMLAGGRLPEVDDLHKLSYTMQVVQEAMRLYPPVWILPRIAQRADEVGGFSVPAKADVLVCPYTLHRHPDLWEDPERFDPSRFEPSRVAKRPRYAYIPFGAGPRFCIGSNLGMMEAVFVTALLTRDLDLDVVPGHEGVAEPMMSLRMRGGLPMTVRSAD
ncbi:Epi-isozizaene 5-monooxygenase/(E)-beta-farnesene synthase (plasmid) [Streptomyces sp. ADI95-16]|uniref:cytochrome P450 n=1 Tax=Streptomyces sp. ADI95-16 TaxID=1522758 RepID=UPI000F3A8C63|nr:cytochrome P450 [Streptomyces sp. ADI95-16]AYV33057.1 Epi-isozizaene 5-monooxygenase/(E)-beta-farnesene synthase [Streptomyces sp. ADI95-16]